MKSKSGIYRLFVEAGFIIFLFYANLLMGEFTRSKLAAGRGWIWALNDIFTLTNFAIGLIAALGGHLFFEMLRRLRDKS